MLIGQQCALGCPIKGHIKIYSLLHSTMPQIVQVLMEDAIPMPGNFSENWLPRFAVEPFLKAHLWNLYLFFVGCI